MKPIEMIFFGDILEIFSAMPAAGTAAALPVLDGFELIGNTAVEEVPLALGERNKSTMWFALLGLTVSFLLIAMSNYGTNKLVMIFARVLYKNNSVEKIVQEEYSLTSFSSVLLLLNFVVTSTVLLYLSYLHNYARDNYELFYLFPVLPLYFFLWPLIWFNLVGGLTGEGKLLSENKKNAVLFAQIIGLLFSFLLLVWTFNLQWSTYFIVAFVFTIVVFWIFKFLRGIVFSRQHQISWAYILLYAITLELLPLLISYNILYRQ